MTTTTSQQESKGASADAMQRTADRFQAKYGDLSDVMGSINVWRNIANDFHRPYNRDMEHPVTLADVEKAEAEMLAAIRRKVAMEKHMAKRRVAGLVIAGVFVATGLVANMLTTVVLHTGERKWSAACGGPDHAITYQKVGVYLKDCTAPKQLF